jgi:antitoxin component of RelBE/YafQ-DinJ toxin-antitoxin module
MSETAVLNIKTDAVTKRGLRAFADEIGITSTALVNILIRQALRDRRIVISTELEPTPYLEGLMREADREYDAGKIAFMGSDEFLGQLDGLKGDE